MHLSSQCLRASAVSLKCGEAFSQLSNLEMLFSLPNPERSAP
jgi:hypothetical protein